MDAATSPVPAVLEYIPYRKRDGTFVRDALTHPYYAGHGYMPLRRVQGNPAAICELCRQSPRTRFVLFHIGYPYYEEMLPVAKHYPNAYLDMCWSWIINPVASKDFLKKYLVTAPANKLSVFGGDYIPVEPIPGHAAIARQGIAQALSELVDEGWMSLKDALSLTDMIMHQNARDLYGLKADARTAFRC